jgi:hypothetical protein
LLSRYVPPAASKRCETPSPPAAATLIVRRGLRITRGLNPSHASFRTHLLRLNSCERRAPNRNPWGRQIAPCQCLQKPRGRLASLTTNHCTTYPFPGRGLLHLHSPCRGARASTTTPPRRSAAACPRRYPGCFSPCRRVHHHEGTHAATRPRWARAQVCNP